MMKKISYSGLLIAFIVLFTNVNAGHLEFSNRIFSVPAVSNILVTDQLEIEVNPKTGSFTDYKVSNILTLGVDHHYDEFFATAMEVKVKFSLSQYNSANSLVGTSSKYLTIKYDPFGGAYQDKSSFLFSNAYRFVAEIDSIYVNGVPKDSLPGLLFVEGYTNIDRFYNFSSAATTPIVLNALTTSEVDCDGADDHITVSWPAVTGAEEYHLEWSFVNDYNDSLTFKPASALILDFRNNATRVSTKAENYSIPLLFEHGYLAFRVRPVGRDHSSPDNYIFGVWSLPEKVKASDLDTSVVHVIFPHEANKNWQVTTTFAEEGKKKEVISYFDGTLRNRQTVTRINSDNHIIVGQTIYDHQGRPAVTVLPVPVQDSVCDNSLVDHSLKYYPNFNLDDTLNLYGRNDFDLDDPDSACAANAAPMSVTSGSSNYYSNDNPNQTGYQSYVPNSEKYPLVQVEYTPDNTGRIRRQGGVGPEFQLGSGHETFYYYGQPNQIQLDRLFGSEAGDAAHYKKNVVIDPNGQASVSYLDQEGRVIATSLAGDTTQNLLALDSENGAAVQLTIDLFSKNSNGVSNTNVVTQDSTGIKFSTQLLVAYSSNFEFNYSIEVDTVDDACLKDNICFHCVYDLVISIHDECMQLVYSTDTIIGHFTMEDTLIVFDTLCTDPTALNFDRNFNLALEPGNYTVYKHLRINDAAMEHYLNLYLDTTYNSCFKSLEEFQNEFLSAIDSSSCEITCESCIDALGDRDEFVASGNGTAFEWDRRYEECRLMCTDTEEPCEAELMMMLGDVSPNGQYGQYLTGSGSFSPTSFPLSVFNQTNKLPESWNTPGQAYWRKPKIELNETVYPYYVDEDNQRSKVYIVPNGNNYTPAVSDTSSAYVFKDNQGGKYTWPENLSDVADFIDLWKTSWSRSLVYLHPEICYYQTCLSYSEKAIDTNSFSSHSFDVLLRNTNSFYQAKNAGLIKSNYASFPDPNDRVTDWFINQSGTSIAWDPFVVYNTGYGPALEQVFDTYVTYGSNSYSMVEIAALTARCGGLTGINPSGTCLLFGSDMYPGGPAALNDSIRNLEWNNLRSFYLSKKLIIQSNYADNIALNDCEAVNDCIGNQNFNAVESGMFSGGGFTNSPWFDGSHPCSVHNYQYYLNKTSRFPDPSDMEHIVGSSDVHDVNYQHYLQTGQCPLAVHMQEMLGALVQADVLDSTDIQMMQFPVFSTWFLDFSGYSVNSGINTFDLYWNTTSAGNTITISISNGSGGATICTGSLVKDTSIASWDDISFFTGIQYTHSISNQHYFTMQAAIPNHPDSLLPFSFYTVTGNTCRNIGDCKFPQECRPTDLAVDLERLISVIALDQELDASSLNIETDYSLLITPRIRAALGTPNSDLRWNWDLSTHSFQLYDQTSPSRKIVIQISDVLPATFNFYNLDSIRGISGLNGTYEHYFVMKGTDTSGLEIVQFNGKIFLEEPSDSSQIFLGDCGRREPMACREMPYQTRNDLSKLMKDVLLNQHPDSINLFSSIYMTDVLLSYYPDTNSHSTSNYIEYTSPGDTLFADTLRIVMDNCLVELYHDDDNDPSLPLDSLIGVGDLVAYGDPSDDGNYYSFLIPVTYSISNTTYTDTLYGTSCFPLKNCVPCPQEQEEMEIMMMVGGSSMNEEEINNALGQLFNLTENTPYTDSIAALFGLVYDPTYANYSGYVHEINELNARNSWSSSDSLFVTPVSYEEFALRGYAAMNASYKRYIHHYIHGLDSYEWLNNPVKFALGYGTGYNVNAEYQRYLAAVTRYNERAEAEGISDISPMNVSTYRTEKYAERTAEYVDYIESYPQSGNPGDGIYDYYNSGFMMMAMSYPDSCDSLYQIYLAAYTDFENYQALHPTCLDYQDIAPLFSYSDFEYNNLCCSDTGLALILDYIATLQDTMQCPGPLPYLATCDTVPDSTCFILYMQYLDDIDEYNESDYAAWADDSIINPYPTFESFVRSGLCSCQDQFHEYIAPYLNSPADTTLALPQSIDEYAPCINTIATDKNPCGEDAYSIYYSAVVKYNSWVTYNPGSGWPTITSTLASNQFTPARYCYCVDAYVAFLKSIQEGMIPYSSSLLYKLSLIESCNNKITAECTPTQTITNIPPSPTVDPGNPCLDYLVDMALFNAQNAYNQYTDSLANAFRNKYRRHCLKALETFEAEYMDKEYHFTLYYYDQAGNLVKTVPPEGVTPLNITSYQNTLAQQVNADRTNGTHTVFTGHLMATTYEYNSLNQLVKQYMPDHDPMSTWETSLPNGLDTRLQVTDIKFIDGNVGYLSGNITYPGSITRGWVYKTNDGGATWSKVSGLAGTDLKKVFWVNDTLGYAVGSNGIMLKTINAGYNWDVLNGYRSSHALGQLNDLYFSSVTTGIFVGANGVLLRTTDGGSTFTLIAYAGKLATDEILSVSGTGVNVYMAVSRSSIYHRHSVIYNSANTGSSWTQGTSYRTMDLRDVQYMSNGKIQAGGNSGHFLERLKVGSTFNWWQKTTNTEKNFKQFYFINDNEGIAIVDSISGYGQIYKTTDRGDNWELISEPGAYYNAFFAYKTSGTTHKLVAVGRDRLVHRIIMMSGQPFGIIPMSNPPSTANNNFRACWAVEQANGETWIFAGNDNGNVYFTDEGSESIQSWVSKGTLANGVRKIMFKNYVSGSTITLAGAIVNNTASSDAFPIFFDASKTLTIGNYSPAPIASATFNDLEVDDSNNRIYLQDETNRRIYLAPISGSSITTTATLLNAQNPIVTPLALTYNQNDTLFSVHATGGITFGVINNSVSPPTITWTQDVNNTRMPVVNDVQYNSTAGTYFVCGDGGFFGRLSAGVWQRLMVNVIDNFNSIKPTSSTAGYLAADNGKVFSYTIATNTVTCTELSTPVSVNLNDVLVNGNALIAVGDEGTILFSNNISTTPLVRLNFNSTSDLHGVALRPGTVPAYTTVGENSTITLSFGGLVLQQKNIALPYVRNISFTDANNGFVLADRFNIRQTSDGGQNWTPVKPGASFGTAYPVLNRILATSSGKAMVVGNARWAANISNLTTAQISVSSFGGSGLTHLMDVATNGNVIFVAGENGANGQLWQKTGTGAWGLAASSGAPLTGFPLRKVHMFSNGNILLAGTNGKICYYNDVNNVTTNWTAPTGLTSNTWLSIFFHDDLNGYVVGENGVVLKTSNNSLNGSGYHVFGSWERMGTDDDLNSQTDSTLMTIRAIGFANRNNGFIGGSYNGTPAGYARRVNDQDGRYSTLFWYDKLGRIVLSQNTKQASTPANERRYSYTRYDALGRVFEAGELTDTVSLTSGTAFRDIFGDYIANYYNPDVINDDSLAAFIGNNLRKEVTRSYYDSTWINSTPSGFAQNHLRKRIAHVTYEDTYDGIDTTYDHATHYSYDIHGNVKTLVQDNKKLADSTGLDDQQFKRIDYDYDLISGNVHRVSYQKDSIDAFHHKYEYNADNHIIAAFTSNNKNPNYNSSSLWENDVKYFYYLHGPIARVEIGELKIQGVDYIYNLQGWIKGVNSITLDSLRDPGLDGWINHSNPNAIFAKDVFGYSLNYHTNDYIPINSSKIGASSFNAELLGSDLETYRFDLFNGNISSMITTITNPTTKEVLPLGNAYRYDQLNRLVESRGFTNLNIATNQWQSGGGYGGNYFNAFAYDANGNIFKQLRKDHSGGIIDSLTYCYAKNTSNHIIQNRLYHVNDNTDYNSNDIDDMGTFTSNLSTINTSNNYRYTKIGELYFDKQEEIERIKWTIHGKIKEILRPDSSTRKELSFDYDSQGQKIAKHIYSSSGQWEKSIYYVRDASGNVLSTYEHILIDSLEEISFRLSEQHIYGSSRIGIYERNDELIGSTFDTCHLERILGEKKYEVSNHLGNVLSVFSDKLIPIDDNNDGTTDRFIPEVIASMDYSPFGVILEGRNFNQEEYRYSFQGQESDHEIKGIGNSIEFEYRMHDPRLGRFLSIDPLAYMYPANSTFAFAENDVIRAIDIEGQEKGIVSHSGAASSWFVVDLSNPAFEDVKAKIELKIGHQLSSTDVVRMNIYYYADKQQGYVESSVTDASGNVLYMDKKNFDNRGFWTILMREGPFNAFGGAGTGENIDAYYRKPENGMKLAASTAGFWIVGFYFGWLNAAEFGADEISDAQKSISQSTKPAFKKYIWDDARDTHIFRKKGGHLEVASEANKKMFLDIANGGGEFLGIDEHGNEWFHKMNDDGTQTWVETRNGKVLNAGINNPDDIRTFNSKTGLSNKEKPKNFNPRNKKKGS